MCIQIDSKTVYASSRSKPPLWVREALTAPGESQGSFLCPTLDVYFYDAGCGPIFDGGDGLQNRTAENLP